MNQNDFISQMQRLCDNNDWKVFINEEKNLYMEAIKESQKKRTFLDVGSYIGTWCILASSDFDKVIGIEPVPILHHIGNFNCRHLDNYTSHNYAIGTKNKNGMITFAKDINSCSHIETQTERNEYLENKYNYETKMRLEVPFKKLDSLELEDIDMIRIDTEGFEYYVLEGGNEFFKINRPLIVIEINHCSSWYDVKRIQINKKLSELDYTLVEIVSEKGDSLWIPNEFV